MTPTLKFLNGILPPKLAAAVLVMLYSSLILGIFLLVEFDPHRVVRYLDAG
jgi:hypothetical protein